MLKYAETKLFVLAAIGLLVTTAAQPNSTWILLNEGYGLHYTRSGRQEAVAAEVVRLREPLLAALETCHMPSVQKWIRAYGRAEELLRWTGGEDAESMAITERYFECFPRTSAHPQASPEETASPQAGTSAGG